MKCPTPAQWDLLAMEALEADEAERFFAHARVCPACRETWQAARRSHVDRVRMYEAFDHGHDEQREQLMAVLPEEPPRRENAGWTAGFGRRLGGLAMSMNKSFGRRAAAVLVPAACIVVGLLVFLAPKQDAFAAALKHLREAATITSRYQMFMNDAEQPMMEGKLYMSSEQGMRFDMEMGSFLPNFSGMLPGGGSGGTVMSVVRGIDGPVVVYNPVMNFAFRMYGIENMQEDPRTNTPDAFIRKFMEMADKADMQLGRSRIDGREVEGYEVSGEKLGLNLVGSGLAASRLTGQEQLEPVMRLWIDVHDNLPVRMEVELSLPILGGRMLATYDQFEWNAPLADSLFTLSIPEGTREIEVTFPPMTEETLIEGLGVFADWTGRYPTELNPTSMTMQMSIAAATSGKIAANPEDPLAALTGDFMNQVMKMQVAGNFVLRLGMDGHEPEYFGDVVTPEDAKEVLLRWRQADGSSRVIYGDLRAETVKP
jgi:outer membrane lipoprotein-sorting protein